MNNRVNNIGNEEFPGFRVLENECIWMKAGVVNFHLCDRAFDCLHCAFDRDMRGALDAQRPRTDQALGGDWARDMRARYRGGFKPCPYYLNGQLGQPENCTRDYYCDGCPIEHELGYAPLSTAVEVQRYAHSLAVPEHPFPSPRPGEGVIEHQCVWSRAGVVNFRHCDNDYDCRGCDFDRSMRHAMGGTTPGGVSEDTSAWEEKIRARYAPSSTPCIHFLAGSSNAPPVCNSDYDCASCFVHRREGAARLEERPPEPSLSRVRGFDLAGGYYYHFGHGWARLEHDGRVRIGGDDFVARLFGKPVTVELPEPGTVLTRGNVGWIMARNGHRAPVLSPVSGTVLARNRDVETRPELSHDHPYGAGWLLLMEPNALERDLNSLYFGRESTRWLEQEEWALQRMLWPAYERLSATGGAPVDDLFAEFHSIGWNRLVKEFLRVDVGPGL